MCRTTVCRTLTQDPPTTKATNLIREPATVCTKVQTTIMQVVPVTVEAVVIVPHHPTVTMLLLGMVYIAVLPTAGNILYVYIPPFVNHACAKVQVKSFMSVEFMRMCMSKRRKQVLCMAQVQTFLNCKQNVP